MKSWRFFFFTILSSSVFASLKKSRWEDTRLATKPVLENLEINQVKKSQQFQINKEKMNDNNVKKNVSIRYKFQPLLFLCSLLFYNVWEVSTLTNYKILVLSKNITGEVTKDLGWLNKSPDCSKSDISNSYLLPYVPSASRHYSAIKMCLKDISYCQREYIHERACAVIDTCGLKSASDWYSSFFRTYLRGKKTIERMSI